MHDLADWKSCQQTKIHSDSSVFFLFPEYAFFLFAIESQSLRNLLQFVRHFGRKGGGGAKIGTKYF